MLMVKTLSPCGYGSTGSPIRRDYGKLSHSDEDDSAQLRQMEDVWNYTSVCGAKTSPTCALFPQNALRTVKMKNLIYFALISFLDTATTLLFHLASINYSVKEFVHCSIYLN